MKERFAAASVMKQGEVVAARALRNKITVKMLPLMGDAAGLIVPTAPGIAPLRNTPGNELDVFLARAIELLCSSGHAGRPQMLLPLAMLDVGPQGLSIIGGRNRE